jgi:hypothetical protein
MNLPPPCDDINGALPSDFHMQTEHVEGKAEGEDLFFC